MDRRTMLAGAGALGVAAATRAIALEAASGWRRYRLTAEIDLAHPGPAQLWVPLAQTAPGYQTASAARYQATGDARVVRDPRYGAAMLRVSWPAAPGERTVTVEQTIATRERGLLPAHLSAHERRFWTAAIPSMPTDGIVRDTAQRIVGGETQPRAKARAIYDWVVDNTFRDAAVRGCGFGGVEGMLKTGYLGGKCADINSLAVALCRAAGLPARDVYGVRLGPSRIQPVLGAKTTDVTHAQHCRAEVWLDGEGWLPIDPADVRKVVLEAQLPVTSPQVKAERERLFGSWEMNWAGYNSATDIQPPGATRPPREHFLMYPLAITSAGEVDQLDPDSFRYRLTSTAV
ncbi:MAG TPA: transglutaminase domain-containing protein [Caulobacteraceae bacterium]|nr:transglutaminase domain-containing protein [Caulobacteraceae bacterium]